MTNVAVNRPRHSPRVKFKLTHYQESVGAVEGPFDRSRMLTLLVTIFWMIGCFAGAGVSGGVGVRAVNGWSDVRLRALAGGVAIRARAGRFSGR
jgi:hypothetical protein